MYYGFDIGGSKIALGVFDDTRRLQWEKRVATPKDSYETFLTTIAQLVAEADARFGGQGSVGIGIPGMPETADGTLYAANVPAAMLAGSDQVTFTVRVTNVSGASYSGSLVVTVVDEPVMSALIMTPTVLPFPKPGMMNFANTRL